MLDNRVGLFLRGFNACGSDVGWCAGLGIENHQLSELWDRDDLGHEFRVWVATRTGVLGDLDSREFACWCVRRIWRLLEDGRCRDAMTAVDKPQVSESERAGAKAVAVAAVEAAEEPGVTPKTLYAARSVYGAVCGDAWGAAAWAVYADAADASARAKTLNRDSASAAWAATAASWSEQARYLADAGNPFIGLRNLAADSMDLGEAFEAGCLRLASELVEDLGGGTETMVAIRLVAETVEVLLNDTKRPRLPQTDSRRLVEGWQMRFLGLERMAELHRTLTVLYHRLMFRYKRPAAECSGADESKEEAV